MCPIHLNQKFCTETFVLKLNTDTVTQVLVGAFIFGYNYFVIFISSILQNNCFEKKLL